MDNIKIKIGEREIPLRFKMPEFAAIEEEIGNLGEIKELLVEGKKRVRNMVTAIRIMGNAGLKHEGEKPDLTDEWLMENMEPVYLRVYQMAVTLAMKKEEDSEAVKEEQENKDRDLVLEEIEAKKGPVNSLSGG